MCGICGVWNYGDGQPVGRPDLEKMRDTLTHRGPDDAGCYFDDHAGLGLGFRRLSIIDLSTAGHQPMSNEDGTVWVVFNGEIYNFHELRHELEAVGHRFKSRTDTETIVHGYEQWGVDVVRRLRGMFAFAIWDRRRQQLLLARDPIGIKPLFYHQGDQRVVFGSELKAVLAAPGVPRKVNQAALYDYLTYNYIPCPNTAYEGIGKLPPAHYLIAGRHGVDVQRYWTLDPADVVACGERTAIDRVRGLLEDAVRSHMLADVPVGVFLSGGLDSSLVASLMARAQAEPIHTFSIGFDPAEGSELPFARAVADRIHSQHHERVVAWSDAQAQLARLVAVYDEPFADASGVPTLAVSTLAREQVKVALSGEGGDEVFAGYPWYLIWLRQQSLRRVVPPVAQHLAKRMADGWPFGRGWRAVNSLAELRFDHVERYARMMEWVSVDEKRRIVAPDVQRRFAGYDDRWYLRQFWREDADPLSRMQYVDLNTYLPDDLLVKVDRASMAVSLEVRVPLLDAHLVKEVFRFPAALRIRDGVGKHLARSAMNADLPDTTTKRVKQGFTPPLQQWLSGDRRSWARALLDDGAAVQAGFLRRNVVDLLSARPDWYRAPKIWVLLVLEMWLRREVGMPTLAE